ncbi:MAG: hypothetical protein GX214_07500 [Clostridiales bacterium]|nr:hypothetical protein [Clostridiales bacterium]
MKDKKTYNILLIFSIFIIIFSIIMLFVTQDEKEKGEDIIDIYIYMEESDLEELYSRDIMDDTKMDALATTSVSGSHLQPIEIRFRGHSTRSLDKKSFNVKFHEPQHFLYGSKRLNLLATYSDPTLMREKIAMDMFKDLGLIAPRSRYFNLYLNDIYEGLYIHTERIDEDLLIVAGLNPLGTLVRDRFTVNLHKDEVERGSLFGYDIESVEDPIALIEDNFEYRGEPDWEKVVELAKWVYNTPAGTDYYNGFKERFELDGFVDWLALHLLIGDIDAFADDHWLYIDHTDPEAKWRIIPWDKDLSFGITYRPDHFVDNDYFAYEYDIYKHGYRGNDLIAKFLQTDELRNILFDRIEYLMEEVFTLEYFQNKTRELESIISESANIRPGENAFRYNLQNHHGQLGHRESNIEALLDFVELRYNFLDREINKVKESINTATVDLNQYKKGDTIYFTDSAGWTIGKIEVDKIKKPGKITLSVRHKPDIQGVNRIWKLIPESADISGKLTLYYRNEVYVFGKENWYETDEAIGRQWDLTIASYKNGNIERLPSHVNPYSNKLTTEKKININEPMDFVITY